MAIADWVIIGIVVLSSLISLMRGFVREALSLLIWVVAFAVAMIFHPNLEIFLADYLPAPSLRRMAGFGLLFMAVLLVGGLISKLIVQLVKVTGLTGTDRLLGTVFGFMRGIMLLLTVFVLLPKIVPIDQDEWYQESVLIPRIMMLEDWGKAAAAEMRELLTGVADPEILQSVIEKEV